MEEKKWYCGIDVSNEKLDICIQNVTGTFTSFIVTNSEAGFKDLWKRTGSNFHFVYEATGVYHMALSFFLYHKKGDYSIVNALQIKRYIQMHLERNKNDQKDAKRICEYGIHCHPKCTEMPDNLYFECKMLNNAIKKFTQQITSLKNQIHAVEKLPIANKLVIKTYKKLIATLQAEIINLEAELHSKLLEWQPELVARVQSVTSIGKRATATLIVYTQGFKFTESYQQLISYAGLSPREYSSGSSIRGKSRICKQGGEELRHTLYMCALNAIKNNTACKILYDRLVAKGKNKKLAIIAVCNKLLKQVFAVVKNQTMYDNNFMKKVA